MSLPFKYLDNLFAVAAWTTHNNLAINGQLITTDLIEGGDRSKFTIRDVVVRGPLMLKHTESRNIHGSKNIIVKPTHNQQSYNLNYLNHSVAFFGSIIFFF